SRYRPIPMAGAAPGPAPNQREIMTFRRCLIAAFVLLPLACGTSAVAQSGDPKTGEQAAAAAEAAKEATRKSDEYAEAAKTITGPAGNAECVWLGRRVVNL